MTSSSPRILAIALFLAAVGCTQLTEVVNKNQLTIPITQSIPVSFDMGQALGVLAGQTATADLAQDVTVPTQTIDLVTSHPDLAKYKNRVKSIEVVGITATPTANTMTGSLPELDLYVGAIHFAKLTEAAKLAAIPPIVGGSLAPTTATINAADAAKAGAILATLTFDQQTIAKLVVKKGEKAPGGKIDLTLELKLNVIVNTL